MNKKTIKTLYYIVMVVGIVYFLVMGSVSHGKTIMGVLQRGDKDAFMDLFNSMQYGCKPYKKGVIYPPLANLLYLFLSTFFSKKALKSGTVFVRDSHMGLTMIALYITVTTILLMYTIAKNKKGTIDEKFAFGITMVFSMPFIFQVERANIVLLCALFIAAFLGGYQSEKQWVRQLSYISLAIAVGLKIYPVFFGFLLLRERRWKDAIVCVIYGLLIFFMPFLVFGGFQNVGLMIENIVECTTNMGLSLIHI